MEISRKELIQEIGNIIGFSRGIELGELADLFIRILAKELEELEG